MLILNRKKEETLVIGGCVEVKVVEVKGHRVRLGVTAPDDIRIHRGEVAKRIRAFEVDIRAAERAPSALVEKRGDATRRKLSAAMETAELLRRQIGQGDFNAAVDAVEKLNQQLLDLGRAVSERVEPAINLEANGPSAAPRRSRGVACV